MAEDTGSLIDPKFIILLIFCIIICSSFQILEKGMQLDENTYAKSKQNGLFYTLTSIPLVGIVFDFFTVDIYDAPELITLILNLINLLLLIIIMVISAIILWKVGQSVRSWIDAILPG